MKDSTIKRSSNTIITTITKFPLPGIISVAKACRISSHKDTFTYSRAFASQSFLSFSTVEKRRSSAVFVRDPDGLIILTLINRLVRFSSSASIAQAFPSLFHRPYPLSFRESLTRSFNMAIKPGKLRYIARNDRLCVHRERQSRSRKKLLTGTMKNSAENSVRLNFPCDYVSFAIKCYRPGREVSFYSPYGSIINDYYIYNT